MSLFGDVSTKIFLTTYFLFILAILQEQSV